MASTYVLKRGEAAVASFPRYSTLENLSNSEPENTPPAIGIKIGDGKNIFSNLPWVQAIAADVYDWAKQSSKPSYSASEIQGLDNYIENYSNSSSGGSSTIAARIYQLVEGSGDDIHKFYLRYTEDAEHWYIDTSSYIDLNDLNRILNWITTYNLEEYPNLTTRTADQIRYFLNTLNVEDTALENQFVTSVSQEGGQITITRARPTFLNIAGTATVSQGGTGKNTLNENEVLVGNGTDAIRTIPIAEEIAANNHLVPNYLIKAYVDQAVSGLEGAMHFIGDANVPPVGGVNPQIAGYNFGQAQPGDVVLWEQKEYVWTGGNWRLLGDEGSYAVKGSIKDVDIDTEANIAQSKIAGLQDALAGKVDKEAGKGLSTNDYTTEEKQKLASIEEGAQKNAIEHILLNEVEQVPHDTSSLTNVVELNIKEFDDTSRAKLATIAEGANVNIIEGISLNGVAQAPDANKNVNLVINEFTIEQQRKLEGIEEGAQVNTIETIYLNNTPVSPDQNKRIDLVVQEITQAQIEKLDSIETGAQVNIIEGIKVDGQTLYPDNNKVISITTDPHTEHINVIEGITVNGTTIVPDQNKIANITIDASALNLIHGAEVPDGSGEKESVDVINKQLQFAAIAKSGDVKHLVQTQDTYIILNCGSSTEVI